MMCILEGEWFDCKILNKTSQYLINYTSLSNEINKACIAEYERENMENGIFSSDDKWYDSYLEAYRAARIVTCDTRRT